MKIINVTPHAINLVNRDGSEFVVPPSGVVISATPIEEPAGFYMRCGAFSSEECPEGFAAGDCHACLWTYETVRTKFIPSPEADEALAKLEREHPGAIIVGSIIAAQAFPGRVLAMVPAPGFERVPPEQKKMLAYKFTTF